MKLLILQGCPCSGKSTFAEEWVRRDNSYVIINRDSIRYLVGEGKYTLDKEDEVSQIELEEMENAYIKKKNIIQDATNLNEKTIEKWKNWADEHGYEIDYKEFYIPYHEAMKRSKARRDAGGLYINRTVMRRFYRKYYPEKFREEMTDNRIKDIGMSDFSLPKCVIFDLDGTIALHNGREPFEWELLGTDVFDSRLRYIMNAGKVIFITGRPEVDGKNNVRELTEEWLKKNLVDDYILLMREKNDYRTGDEVKKDIYEKHIKGKYNVIYVLDDSNKCVDMWRKEGLLCLQPINGDY